MRSGRMRSEITVSILLILPDRRDAHQFVSFQIWHIKNELANANTPSKPERRQHLLRAYAHQLSSPTSILQLHTDSHARCIALKSLPPLSTIYHSAFA